MMPTLLLAVVLTADSSPARFAFVDAAGPDGARRDRPVKLADSPPRPLTGTPPSAAGTRFGSARVGSDPESALGLVWQPAANLLWLDGDGDGILAAAERHAFSGRTLQLPVTLRVGTVPLTRTLLLRRTADDGLAAAVRGHTRGTIAVAGKSYAAALADGDADGCFDGFGEDRVWIDLNGDGTFDPLAEQFPLGTPVAVGGERVLIRPDPTGTEVRVQPRGGDVGRLKPALALQPGAVLRSVDAAFVSEFGEQVVLRSLDAAAVPAGRYRVATLQLKVSDAAGRLWAYEFHGGRSFDVTVPTNGEAAAGLLAGLEFAIGVRAEKARPGEDVSVSPRWQSAAGAYLVNCEVSGTGTAADVALVDSGGTVLGRTACGFL